MRWLLIPLAAALVTIKGDGFRPQAAEPPPRKIVRPEPKPEPKPEPPQVEIARPPAAPEEPERIWTLQDGLELAAKDIARVSPVYRPAVRYLWLGSVPARERETWHRVLGGHVNHLSTESDIVRPEVVDDTDGSLLRIVISNYGAAWPKQWEKLADADPYFHVQLVATKEVIETDEKGKKVAKKVKVTKSAFAPWLVETRNGQKAFETLTGMTGSQVPIVRGDWFVWQTGIQADRTPGYYDFLGVANQKDYERLVGFDKTFFEKSGRVELLEAVEESRVAQQPRRIAAYPTIGTMRLWRTFDNSLAVDKANPLRILDGDLKFLASEEFASLPNGLWAFGLFEANGGRQDSAPDFIGPDSTSHNNDGRIHVGLSCIRCHYSDGGLKPFDGWVRGQLEDGLKLKSPDPNLERKLRQQYGRDLLYPLEDDRRVFARHLFDATKLTWKERRVDLPEMIPVDLPGMTPAEYGIAYGKAWAAYDSPVTLERAAHDLGMTSDRFVKIMQEYAEIAKNDPKQQTVDLVLSNFISPRRQPRPLPLRTWHETFPQIQGVIRGQDVPARPKAFMPSWLP